MIHNQAVVIANGLVDKKIIKEDSADVYAYGFELLLSALINIIIIATISILFGRYYDWILFLTAFVPLRMTAGGYHASSHFKCIVTGAVAFTIPLLLSHIQIDWTYAIITIAIISFTLIIAFSPVEAHNKKLSIKRLKQNRKISIYIAVVNMVLALSVGFINGFSEILYIYYTGVFAAALSMLVVKLQRKKDG